MKNLFTRLALIAIVAIAPLCATPTVFAPTVDEVARICDQTAGIAGNMAVMFRDVATAEAYFLGRRDAAREIADLIRTSDRVINVDGLVELAAE